MDSVLRLLGVARKAGRVEVGEEPVGAACRARDCRLILVARDAADSAARAHQAKVVLTAADGADNSIRRAAHFAEAGKIQVLPTPYTKGELGGAVGRSACTMLALTDIGLAAAIAEKLAQADPERCGGGAEAPGGQGPPASEGAPGPREELTAQAAQALGASPQGGEAGAQGSGGEETLCPPGQADHQEEAMNRHGAHALEHARLFQ